MMQAQETPQETPRRRLAKLSGHSRDRTGCLTCRQRKKKCDGSRGKCEQCRRLNLRCLWEPERDILDAVSMQSGQLECTQQAAMQSIISKAPNPMQFWAEITEDGTSATWSRRLALRYYVQSFSTILATNIEKNEFLSGEFLENIANLDSLQGLTNDFAVLLPMAMESSTLLKAIVAWSSSHLALCQVDLSVKALEDRSAALGSLASSFANENDSSQEFLLATCLTMCSMESILGDTAAWYEHLSGAASIIKSTLRQTNDRRYTTHLQKTIDGKWLLRNFAYRDILASVTLNTEPLIPGLCWMNEETNFVDTYFGLATLPMLMLSEISSLHAELKRESSSDNLRRSVTTGTGNENSRLEEQSLTIPSASARASQIESILLDWQPGQAQDYSLICHAESYRSAALIHLYRSLRYHRQISATTLKTKISREVNSIIEHVKNMPVACLPECTLLLPLFLAGGEVDDPEQMQLVRERMQEMVNYRRFQNIRLGLDVLEEVWDVRSRTLPIDPFRPYDWLDVLERRGWKLAVS